MTEVRGRKPNSNPTNSSISRSKSHSNLLDPSLEDEHPRKKKRARSASPERQPDLDDTGESEEEAPEERGHSLAVHTSIRSSVLAQEGTSQDYRGMWNLAGLVLFVTHFRLVLENLLKYGLLIQFNGQLWHLWRGTTCVICLLGFNVFILITFAMEKYAKICISRRFDGMQGPHKKRNDARLCRRES